MVSATFHTGGRCTGVVDLQIFTTQEIRMLRNVVEVSVVMVERDIVQQWVSNARNHKKGHFEHMLNSIREGRKDPEVGTTDEEEEFSLSQLSQITQNHGPPH